MHQKISLFMALFSLAAGCAYPIPQSSDCDRTINACLLECEKEHPDGDDTEPSPCETSCRSLCTPEIQ